MLFRTQTGWSWNFRSCLQDLVLKKTYSTWPSTTICFHLWESNNQNSKWASKTTAWSRVRCTVFTSPGRLYFFSFSSLSQLSLFAFCLPSRVSWYPVFPYTILQNVQQLAGPASRKAGHEKHDIIYHNALVYKHANIVSHSLLKIACRLHYFQNITLLDVKWCKY